MGFFSKLIKGAGALIRGVIGLPPAAAAVPVAVGTGMAVAAGSRVVVPPATALIARLAAQKAARAAAAKRLAVGVGAIAGGTVLGNVITGDGGGAVAGGGGTALAVGGGIGRGNGQFAKQTIVQTVDLATGTVVRQETFAGAPFAMQKDINRIRTLDRKLTKAANRIRSKSRGPSKTKQLTDAVTDAALRNVVAGCPPKAC